MTGQAGQRVYVSADMEGITGLVDAQDVQPGGADYERGRVLMTGDVNAAIAGIHAAWGEGTGITVNDAHGPMRNILPDLLHPAARLVRGKPKPMGIPRVSAPDARTVEVSGQLPDLYRLFGVFMRVATALTNQPPYC